MAGADAAWLARRALLAAGGVALLASGLFVAVPQAYAAQIQTIICRTPSTVSIDAPANDTVVTNGAMQLSGSVRQANQVEVYIDGVLDSIVPLSVTDTTYVAHIQLQEGTHTIKVTSIDTCQLGNADASVVVSYQPAVPAPSVGATVPTTVGGDTGVRVGVASEAATVPASILPPQITQPLRQLGDELNLNGVSVSGSSPQREVPQGVRFGLISIGLAVVIFSQTISTLGAGAHVLQFAASRLGLHQAYGPQLLIVLIGVASIMAAFLF